MRPLPPPTLGNLNPPVRGYRYFDHAARAFEFASGLDSARNRWLLAECALLAYDEEARIRASFEGAAQAVTMVPATRAGGFCFAVDLDQRDALLGFRGTQVFSPGDSLAKFRGTAGNYLTNARLAPQALANGGRVHAGFHDSASDLVARLRELGLLAAPRRWWLCGHSLGGALAVLAAEQLHAGGHQVGGVLTFGQPRVGDARHAQGLARLPFPILRIVHGCDVIPAVPPDRFGFVHGGREQELFRPERRANYAATVLQNLSGLWHRLRHGVGALSPVALQDHAPLTYATHCYNEYDPDPELPPEAAPANGQRERAGIKLAP